MSAGVFAVSRRVFDHPLFAPEPFTEREAWIWMVGEAAWKPCRVRAGRAVIDLSRGQFAHSMRFMASKWQWSEARVRRFLVLLENDAMVYVLSDALTTRITICNYDTYQKVGLPSDALATHSATHSRRTRDAEKKQLNKKQEISSLRSDNARAPARELVEEFHQQFWEEYPNKVGKPAALRAWPKARKKASLSDILDGLARYKSDKPPDRNWLNPATFLNQERWADQPALNGKPVPVAQSPPEPLTPERAAIYAEIERQYGGSRIR